MANTVPTIAALPPHLTGRALDLIEYMLGPALKASDANVVLTEMSDRIRAAGLPLERTTSIVPLLHAEDAASARFWEKGKGARNYNFPFSRNTQGGYHSSPAADAHRTREWVVLWLPDTPDEKYEIVGDLKRDGFVHYVMMPVFMANGMSSTFSFATRHTSGFSADHFAFLRAVFPAIAAAQEILATHRIMSEVLRTYVGHEPQQRILAGDVHRGEVMHIQSAILFADMRRFTELTSDMSAESATRLLNAYYDCVVPAIESEGGEVLKFMADGILAIFRGADGSVCDAAARAASRGLSTVAARNEKPEFDVGISLHHGEVAFGNVGSGVRLDYTVIGRDVNLASRLASLCGTLNAPLLVSAAFRKRARAGSFKSIGQHALKGLSTPEEVFEMALVDPA